MPRRKRNSSECVDSGHRKKWYRPTLADWLIQGSERTEDISDISDLESEGEGEIPQVKDIILHHNSSESEGEAPQNNDSEDSDSSGRRKIPQVLQKSPKMATSQLENSPNTSEDTMNIKELIKGQANIIQTLQDFRQQVGTDIKNAVQESVTVYEQRCKQLELKVTALTSEVAYLKNEKDTSWSYKKEPVAETDLSVIIRGLPEGDDLAGDVDHLISHIYDGDHDAPKVLQVKRLYAKYERESSGPALVKAAFESLAVKLEVVRKAYERLDGKLPYKNVSLQPSRSHADRVAEKNLRLLMEELKLDNRFKMLRHGLIVKKDDPRYIRRQTDQRKGRHNSRNLNQENHTNSTLDRNAAKQNSSQQGGARAKTPSRDSTEEVETMVYDHENSHAPHRSPHQVNENVNEDWEFPPIPRSPQSSEPQVGALNRDQPKPVRGRGRARLLRQRGADNVPPPSSRYQGGYGISPHSAMYPSQGGYGPFDVPPPQTMPPSCFMGANRVENWGKHGAYDRYHPSQAVGTHA